MKRMLALALALIMLMSLVACGNSTTEPNVSDNVGDVTETPTETPTEGSTQQTDTAEPEQTTGPEQTAPLGDPVEIHINDENWTDYFEIVVEEGTSVYYNGEELPDSVCYFVAKDSSTMIDQISFAMNYTVEKRSYTIGDDGSIVWGEAEAYDTRWQKQFDSYDPSCVFNGVQSPIKVNIVSGAETVERREEYREAFEASDTSVMFVCTVTRVWGMGGTITVYE